MTKQLTLTLYVINATLLFLVAATLYIVMTFIGTPDQEFADWGDIRGTWYRPGIAIIALSVVYGISFYVRWKLGKILNAYPQSAIDNGKYTDIEDLGRDSENALLFRVTSRLASKYDGKLTFLLETNEVPNAAAVAHSDNAWIILSTGALYFWSEQELDSILLHELAHIENEDSPKTKRMLGEIQSLRFYWIGLNWIERTLVELVWAWFTSIFDGGGIVGLVLTIIAVAISIPILILITILQIPVGIAWVFSIWLQKWFSWNRELLADDRVKTSTDGARNLAKAHARVEIKGPKPLSFLKRIEIWAEQDTANGWLRIRKRESPFESLEYPTKMVGFTGAVESLFSTHPSNITRIRRLLDLDKRGARDFISRIRSSIEY